MLVLINVFRVERGRQQELVRLLSETTEKIVSRATGFMSATLHRGLDDERVTMVARWRSREDYDAFRADDASRAALGKALSFAEFEPGYYEIAGEFTART